MRERAEFSRTYARYLPPIQAKCRRLLGQSSAAEDVAQETFTRLWKTGAGEGADARVIMAWLHKTSTRLAIDVLRERRFAGPSDGAEELTPCSLELGAVTAAKAAIQKLAASVPEDELEVAVVCRVDGLSQTEAASVLGISDRTVRRLLTRFDDRTVELRKELMS